MANRDYYAVLGVARDAADTDIKKAYRKLAMQFHPDRNPGKTEWANNKFKEINEAFSVLGDPQKRKQYDQFGTAGNFGDIFSSTSTQSTFEDLMRDFGASELGTGFLNGMFGDLVRNKGFSFKIYHQRPGSSQRFNFEDLFRQAQAYSPAPRDVAYDITISHKQAGRGTEKDLKLGKKKLRVTIPAGIKDGMTVRLRNALQTTEGQPGDIMLHVKVK